MSATTTAARPRAAVRARDSRTFRRLALAAILPLGPLAVTVLRGVLPYETSDSSAAAVAAIAADPGAQTVVVWMGLLALFTLPPGVFALGRLAARGAPVLGTFALVLAGVGYLSLSGLVSGDTLTLTAVQGGLDQAVATRVQDLYFAHPTTSILLGAFVLGHVVGTLLLGLALWRARIIPAWAGILLAISQPLHLVAVIIGSRPLDVLAWGSTALTFAVAALALVRMPDEDYDLPPRPAI